MDSEPFVSPALQMAELFASATQNESSPSPSSPTNHSSSSLSLPGDSISNTNGDNDPVISKGTEYDDDEDKEDEDYESDRDSDSENESSDSEGDGEDEDSEQTLRKKRKEAASTSKDSVVDEDMSVESTKTNNHRQPILDYSSFTSLLKIPLRATRRASSPTSGVDEKVVFQPFDLIHNQEDDWLMVIHIKHDTKKYTGINSIGKTYYDRPFPTKQSSVFLYRSIQSPPRSSALTSHDFETVTPRNTMITYFDPVDLHCKVHRSHLAHIRMKDNGQREFIASIQSTKPDDRSIGIRKVPQELILAFDPADVSITEQDVKYMIEATKDPKTKEPDLGFGFNGKPHGCLWKAIFNSLEIIRVNNQNNQHQHQHQKNIS